MRIRLLLLPFLLTTAFLATVGGFLAQAFLSADAAGDFVYALDGSGFHAIATADPEEPGRFVAALYIPGSQLLVVSALHPSVDAVAYRISRREYREVYFRPPGIADTRGQVFRTGCERGRHPQRTPRQRRC